VPAQSDSSTSFKEIKHLNQASMHGSLKKSFSMARSGMAVPGKQWKEEASPLGMAHVPTQRLWPLKNLDCVFLQPVQVLSAASESFRSLSNLSDAGCRLARC
jgi:hypothetical protein